MGECETLQNTVKENKEQNQVVAELHNTITELQTTVNNYDKTLKSAEEKMKIKLYDKFQGHLLNKFKKILNLEGIPTASSVTEQLEFAFKKILHLSQVQDSLNEQARSAGTYYQMTSERNSLADNIDNSRRDDSDVENMNSTSELLNKLDLSAPPSVGDSNSSVISDDTANDSELFNNEDTVDNGSYIYDD